MIKSRNAIEYCCFVSRGEIIPAVIQATARLLKNCERDFLCSKFNFLITIYYSAFLLKLAIMADMSTALSEPVPSASPQASLSPVAP